MRARDRRACDITRTFEVEERGATAVCLHDLPRQRGFSNLARPQNGYDRTPCEKTLDRRFLPRTLDHVSNFTTNIGR